MTNVDRAQSRAECGSIGAVQVIPSGGPLGAEIRGVDLSKPIDAATREIVIDAFHRHLAIYFRDQELSDQDLVAATALFGEPMADDRTYGFDKTYDYDRSIDTEYPELIDIVSNVTKDGKPIGALGSGEAVWHSDTQPIPNSALVLYALEVPETGGDTRLLNCYRAYEALPQELKKRIWNRILIHCRTSNLIRGQEPDFDRDFSNLPGPWFPLVRTHGDTRRQTLFLGRQGEGHIVGLTPEESNALLRDLWEHAVRPEFVWAHRWKQGDLLVWDNRCTLHSRSDFQGRRRMHRTTARGEWPQ